ncbi:hypothetical protein [Paraburkholderia azotifigens]|uniref:Lipoprotein n=1 Tax=Paraburkholderia azotifigens TaxID=2057004 RepID=A0A5C6VH52_9BURK|nr:hypothetical protein [Paraburkholderia azotifigens]TXC84507.1 hypothetical protein FRZ40_30005 [Paraburkholderia azotifigens]
MKKLNVTGLATVVGALASLAGCAIVPSDPAVLSQMSGSYSVVDQFSYPNTHSTRIDIRFLPVDEHGKTSALVKMYDGDKLRLYQLDDCGYPGDNAARHLSCVFHTKLDSDFAASWTGISREGGHGFHGKLDSDFTRSWTVTL